MSASSRWEFWSGDGSVYLLGIKAGERMHVSWDGQDQCDVVIPTPLPDDLV